MLTDALHHVSFSVENLNDSLHFYCDLLGLEKIERPDMGIDGAWLKAGRAQIHLIVAPEGVDVGAPPKKPTPVANHIAFTVSDYEKTITLLETAGLDVIKSNPQMGQLWVADPSGHVIEFTTQAAP